MNGYWEKEQEGGQGLVDTKDTDHQVPAFAAGGLVGSSIPSERLRCSFLYHCSDCSGGFVQGRFREEAWR